MQLPLTSFSSLPFAQVSVQLLSFLSALHVPLSSVHFWTLLGLYPSSHCALHPQVEVGPAKA